MSREYRERYEAIGHYMVPGHVADHYFRWRVPAYAVGQLGPRLRVLDIGCGDGDIAQRMRKLPNVQSVTLVDVSEPTVSKASEWYGLRGVTAWAEHLPFRDRAFDVALLIGVLEHVLAPVAVAQEAERVARYVLAVVPAVADHDPDHLRVVDLAALADGKPNTSIDDGREACALWRSA